MENVPARILVPGGCLFPRAFRYAQMNFDLSEDQKLLGDQVRRFLRDNVGYEQLRKLIAADQEIDRPTWKAIAELGWLAAAIPEAFGGLGMGALEQCVIAEELGRVVAQVPYVTSSGMAVEAILLAGSDEQQAELLPKLAAGEHIAALAFFEGAGSPGRSGTSVIAAKVKDGRLSGRKWPVIDGGVADLYIVAAKSESDVLSLYVVDAAVQGLTRSRVTGFDQLRAGYVVDFAETPCTPLSSGDAWAVIDAVFDKAAVLAAFEAVGGAEAALEMSRNYAIERKAFGRAIGSYQAIKHRLADMLTKIELARSNAYYAGWALANGSPDRSLAAATARVSATEAYEFAARENMQVHGGISFTWEANCHFHYRRSRFLAVFLGAPAYWNDRIIDRLQAATEEG
jgi:acyl-CoA dehydrogenase